MTAADEVRFEVHDYLADGVVWDLLAEHGHIYGLTWTLTTIATPGCEHRPENTVLYVMGYECSRCGAWLTWTPCYRCEPKTLGGLAVETDCDILEVEKLHITIAAYDSIKGLASEVTKITARIRMREFRKAAEHVKKLRRIRLRKLREGGPDRYERGEMS